MTTQYFIDKATLHLDVGALATASRWTHYDTITPILPLIYLEVELDMFSSSIVGLYTSLQNQILVNNNEQHGAVGWIGYHPLTGAIVGSNGVSLGQTVAFSRPSVIQILIDRTNSTVKFGSNGTYTAPFNIQFMTVINGTVLVPFVVNSSTLWTGTAGQEPISISTIRTSAIRFLRQPPIGSVSFDSASTISGWISPVVTDPVCQSAITAGGRFWSPPLPFNSAAFAPIYTQGNESLVILGPDNIVTSSASHSTGKWYFEIELDKVWTNMPYNISNDITLDKEWLYGGLSLCAGLSTIEDYNGGIFNKNLYFYRYKNNVSSPFNLSIVNDFTPTNNIFSNPSPSENSRRIGVYIDCDTGEWRFIYTHLPGQIVAASGIEPLMINRPLLATVRSPTSTSTFYTSSKLCLIASELQGTIPAGASVWSNLILNSNLLPIGQNESFWVSNIANSAIGLDPREISLIYTNSIFPGARSSRSRNSGIAYAEIQQFNAEDLFYIGVTSVATYTDDLSLSQNLILYYDYLGGQIQRWDSGTYSSSPYLTNFIPDGVIQILINFNNNTVSFGTGNVFGTPLSMPSGATALYAASSSSGGVYMNARLRTTAANFLYPIPNGATAYDVGSTLISSQVVNTYTTLDPINKGSSAILNQGNLGGSVVITDGSVKSIHYKNSGKWVWEIKYQPTGRYPIVGISKLLNAVTTDNGYIYDDAQSYLFYGSDGVTAKINNGIVTPYGSTWESTGLTLSLELDLDNGTLELFLGNTSLGYAFIGLVGDFCAVFSGDTNSDYSTFTVNFGQSPFERTPTAGFIGFTDSNSQPIASELPLFATNADAYASSDTSIIISPNNTNYTSNFSII